MDKYVLKKISLFLLFKDCVNKINNIDHDSLVIKTWIDNIEEQNLRKNREDAYSKEYIGAIRDEMCGFIKRHLKLCQFEEDYRKGFEQYLEIHPIEEYAFCEFEDLSLSDRIRLTRGYLDYTSNEYAILILYHPISNDWQYVKERLKDRQYEIISDYILDFSCNQMGFVNLIHDIYDDYNRSQISSIQRKIDLLVKSKLIINVLVVEQKDESKDIYSDLGKIKLEYRDILNFTSDKNAFLNIHSPENRIESEHLKRVLVSVNNLWYVTNRLVNTKEKIFIEKLKIAKRSLQEEGISVCENVVVSTGAMEAAGIWTCNDIDLIGLTTCNGLDGLDFFEEEYNVIECAKKKLSNQAIINDDNYHFYAYGMKFANLLLIKERNLISYSLNVSKKKVACIDSFYNFVNYVDDKEVLNKEIQIEFARRNAEIKQKNSTIRRGLRLIKRVIKIIFGGMVK